MFKAIAAARIRVAFLCPPRHSSLMFIVTGGAGFIGSNLIKALNDRGESDIIVVDDLGNGKKYRNLAGRRIADYLDRDEFRVRIAKGDSFGSITAVFHQGACTDTTEWNGKYMLDANFAYTKEVFFWCQAKRVPLIYASSAAIYGKGLEFREFGAGEGPLNVYGWSKWMFDSWLRPKIGTVEEVTQHDGSVLRLHKLAESFDPTDRAAALAYLHERQAAGEVVTGLLYIDESAGDLNDRMNTVESPMNALPQADLCPGAKAIEAINAGLR
jgi:hypothetical protein